MSFCVTFFSVAPFAPLLKYTCYMCNRQGAHKSHRISSSLCSHDNALLYLYWYLHFMLIWPWCILSYVWWEAIKLFWIWIWIWIFKPECCYRQCFTYRLAWAKLSGYQGSWGQHGPIWGRQDPGGSHIGPMNLAIWGIIMDFRQRGSVKCSGDVFLPNIVFFLGCKSLETCQIL